MKRIVLLLGGLLLCAHVFAANPALGIHNIGTALSDITYTSPTAYNSQTSGSSFIAFIETNQNYAPTVSDTYNTSASWINITLGSGSNPTANTDYGGFWWAYVCAACSGGTNDEITVARNTAGSVNIVDYIEVKNTAAVDVSGAAYAASGAANVSVTPTVSNDMIVASGYCLAAPTAAGGFTALDTGTSATSGYVVGATTSSYNAAMADTQYCAAITVAFKPATAAATTTGGSTLLQFP
jgi:hypothetical protein